MAKVTNDEIDPEVVRALEAILLVAVEPVTTKLLAQVLEQPAGVVEVLCNRLAATYDAAGHGFQLVKVAGGFRLQSRPELSAYVEKFILDGQQARISSAALETLAIVAYRQPVTRAEIEAVRGVGSEEMLRQLLERDLVGIGGRADDLGRPNVYVTTRQFLAVFGLARIEDLPPVPASAGGAPPAPAASDGSDAG